MKEETNNTIQFDTRVVNGEKFADSKEGLHALALQQVPPLLFLRPASTTHD